MRDRTIFLHGFSKAWAMTGFRLGYACGPAELIEAMMKIHQYTMLCASSLSQKAAHRSAGPARSRTSARWWTNTAAAGTSSPRPLRRWAWNATVRWARSTRFPSVAKFGLPVEGLRAAVAARGKGGGGAGHGLRRLRRGLRPLRLRDQHGQHQGSDGAAEAVHCETLNPVEMRSASQRTAVARRMAAGRAICRCFYFPRKKCDYSGNSRSSSGITAARFSTGGPVVTVGASTSADFAAG